MRMRIIIIVNLILLIFLSCSSTITRRELTDISWIRNDSLLLEYQNYEDGNTFDVSDTLMNSSLVFVPFKNDSISFVQNSVSGLCDREGYSMAYPKVRERFYEWLANQSVINRTRHDRIVSLHKNMQWEGKEAAVKLFRKVSEILYLGCLEEDTPYKSFLLLIKYNSEEDGMDSSFFLMNDIVRVVCKDNKVRSLIRIASLMREQTEFVAVWTEKKEDLFSIKRLRGDVWEPFPPEILNEMAHTGERFEEEWEYEMYKIDRNGWLRNDFSDMELDKCRALFGIK